MSLTFNKFQQVCQEMSYASSAWKLSLSRELCYVVLIREVGKSDYK